MRSANDAQKQASERTVVKSTALPWMIVARLLYLEMVVMACALPVNTMIGLYLCIDSNAIALTYRHGACLCAMPAFYVQNH